ncbi:hypothetical protein TNCV_3658961 [Trichonephila clavipes]|nr:hypothetical protein TNCV_3658961 [Trichonephila clavipes]
MDVCKCRVPLWLGSTLNSCRISREVGGRREVGSPTTSRVFSLKIGVELIYSRAFGDGPRHFEPWACDEDGTCAGTHLSKLPHHTNGKTFEPRQI